MSQRRDLPESLNGAGFTTAAAAAMGVPGNRLQSNDLFGVHRGMRVPRGVPQDLEDRLRPILELVPHGVAYRTTAARILGMPLPGWIEDEAPRLELAVPVGTSQIRRPGLAVRRLMLPASDVCDVGGIRITTPERTFADLASLLGLADTVAVGDHLVCAHGPGHPGEREPVVPLDALLRYIAGIKGRHGILRAREARVGVAGTWLEIGGHHQGRRRPGRLPPCRGQDPGRTAAPGLGPGSAPAPGEVAKSRENCPGGSKIW